MVCPLEAKQCWFNNWLCVTVMEIWFGPQWPCSAALQHCHLSAFWHFYIQTWKGGLSSRHTHMQNTLTLMWRYKHKTLISLKCSEPQIRHWRICAIICTTDLRSELLHGLIIRCAKTRRFRNAVTMMERQPESQHSDTPRCPCWRPHRSQPSFCVPQQLKCQIEQRVKTVNCLRAASRHLGLLDCDLFCPSGKISREQEFLMKACAYHLYSLTNNVSVPTASQLTWFILWTACWTTKWTSERRRKGDLSGFEHVAAELLGFKRWCKHLQGFQWGGGNVSLSSSWVEKSALWCQGSEVKGLSGWRP